MAATLGSSRCYLGPQQQAGLGRRVGVEARVAVQVISRDVEDRGHPGSQRPGCLQLEAGDFQHIKLHRRVQEVEGGLAQVAAHGRPQSARPCHLAQQGGDRAFAIGARDRRYGGLGGTGKEFDVPQDLQAARPGLCQGRLAQGDAGADHQPFGDGEGIRIEAPQKERQVGHFLPRHRQPRRIGPGVGYRHHQPLGTQMAGAGQARLAQSKDQGLGMGSWALGREKGLHQRIFRLANPTSTRMTVMIQNRTMTRGSGQPLSSK